MRGREPKWGRNYQNVGSQEALGVAGVAEVFQKKVYKTKLMVSYIM